MTQEIAVREAPRQMVQLSNEQLQYIANTEFVPAGLRGNLPAILACVATGRALGLPDMVALRAIHVIDGKATYSAELMVQLVRRAGHSIVGEVGEGSATVSGVRRDNGDEMTVTWTLAMAERAGLLGKQNWKKYPEAMLWARAASQLCRMLFADCFAGATYTPEELDGDAAAEAVAATVEELSPAHPTPPDVTPSSEPAAGDRLISDGQHRLLEVLLKELGYDRDEYKAKVGVDHMTEITFAEATRLIDELQAEKEALPEALKP